MPRLAVLAVSVLVGCSGSDSSSPTTPTTPPPPPLVVSMAPASAEVEIGETVVFTLQVSGGASGSTASWTCASSDTGVATTSVTDSGCSATGVTVGSVTITAAIMKGGQTSNATASLEVLPPPLVVSMLPASAEVEIGETVVFTLQVSGGASGSTASWTCASSDTGVATTSVTDTGCSATGVAAGSVTITAAIMKGGQTSNVTASLEVLLPPPLVVSMSPTSARVEVGGTALFTLQVSGGAAGSTATWTCASSNIGVATASVTATGCSATGVAAGSVTITAAVTKGSETSNVASGLDVTMRVPSRNDFAYWDANGNGDLTCTEASGKDEGLKLPAYRDNRDGTGVIYEWLERGTSSDSDSDGVACEGTQNPNGYVPSDGSTPPTTSERKCPAGSPTWMGLPVCEEGARTGYDRDAFGSAYSSLEDEIIESLPKSGGQVYTPYTCKLFDIRANGTADTDIEHIVALAEAYDSGLAESQFRTFAGDLDNLTIADPAVNRDQKSDRDAGEWRPPQNSGWFATRVVAVKQKYALSVNPTERDALQSMLDSDPNRQVSC